MRHVANVGKPGRYRSSALKKGVDMRWGVRYAITKLEDLIDRIGVSLMKPVQSWDWSVPPEEGNDW